jgi:hypothetical protein
MSLPSKMQPFWGVGGLVSYVVLEFKLRALLLARQALYYHWVFAIDKYKSQMVFN